MTQCVSEKIAKRYLRLGATMGACGSGGVARIGYETPGSEGLGLSVAAFPNPAIDALTLRVLAPQAGAARVEVLDLSGRAVQRRAEELAAGDNEVKLRLGGLPGGLYLIHVQDGQGRHAAVRVSKQ